MTWEEYVKSIVNMPSCLDNLTFSLGDENLEFFVPPIIKSSILLNEKISDVNKNRNLFVFPETNQTANMFAVLNVVYDIAEGRTTKSYDPYSFIKGQRLKYKGCVFEFDSIETDKKDGKERIFLRLADVTRLGLPIEFAPFLQLTDSKRPLSTNAAFSKVYSVKKAQTNVNATENDIVKILLNYKTHLDASTYFVSPIIRTKNFVNTSTINGSKINQILLIGQTEINGCLKLLGTGQMSGIPALSVAPDIYSVEEALKKGVHIDKLIINISNINSIEAQLDVLDRLLKKRIPIICITDTINSFNLQSFEDRDFQIWRWDEKSITRDLYRKIAVTAEIKIENCKKQEIEYLYCEEYEISEVLSVLYKVRKEVSEESFIIMNIFEKLFSVAFIAIRNVIPFNKEELLKLNDKIDECMRDLHSQEKFITKEMYSDFSHIIELSKVIFSEKYPISKLQKLQGRLVTYNYKRVCFIIPNKADRNRYTLYWDSFVKSKKLRTNILALYVDEYCNYSNLLADLTVATGWFNEISMRKILHSYTTHNFLILLYDYERRWQAPHIRCWKKALDPTGNTKILKKALNISNNIEVFNLVKTDYEINDDDELSEIEDILRTNKYRQFISTGEKPDVETVEAIPITFIGDKMGFYKPAHKMITVTDIIINDSEGIKIKQASEVTIGDFIVIRSAQRDVIREIADIILENSGKGDSIALSKKWKDALEIEGCFSDINEIYEKLRAFGCTRGKATIEQWIKDDDKISPQSKEDIRFIAQVTGDLVLLERLDEVFEAAQDVKRAHIKAGQILSQRLKQKIVAQLNSIDKIDPYNIWDPISFEIETIGYVTILKVIDKSTPIVVDSNNTNRII